MVVAKKESKEDSELIPPFDEEWRPPRCTHFYDTHTDDNRFSFGLLWLKIRASKINLVYQLFFFCPGLSGFTRYDYDFSLVKPNTADDACLHGTSSVRRGPDAHK